VNYLLRNAHSIFLPCIPFWVLLNKELNNISVDFSFVDTSTNVFRQKNLFFITLT
jgi:hypothetical protein